MPILQTERCVAAVSTMTMAMKAQHTLLNAGITAEVVALSPNQTKRGCAFGVEYSCAKQGYAKPLLQEADISVSQFFKKSGGHP